MSQFNKFKPIVFACSLIFISGCTGPSNREIATMALSVTYIIFLISSVVTFLCAYRAVTRMDMKKAGIILSVLIFIGLYIAYATDNYTLGGVFVLIFLSWFAILIFGLATIVYSLALFLFFKYVLKSSRFILIPVIITLFYIATWILMYIIGDDYDYSGLSNKLWLIWFWPMYVLTILGILE